MENSENSWSVPVDVLDIPESGLHLEIEAPEAVRTTLARLANVREVMTAYAVFDLTRRGTGAQMGVHVSGQFRARVGQICVVSLEPMESEIEEPIDLLFLEGAAAVDRLVQTVPSEEELPEPLVGGKVDLGIIATEFLMLGIDPYPRKPDVEFSAPATENGGNYLFAGLEILKKRLGDGQ